MVGARGIWTLSKPLRLIPMHSSRSQTQRGVPIVPGPPALSGVAREEGSFPLAPPKPQYAPRGCGHPTHSGDSPRGVALSPLSPSPGCGRTSAWWPTSCGSPPAWPAPSTPPRNASRTSSTSACSARPPALLLPPSPKALPPTFYMALLAGRTLFCPPAGSPSPLSGCQAPTRGPRGLGSELGAGLAPAHCP